MKTPFVKIAFVAVSAIPVTSVAADQAPAIAAPNNTTVIAGHLPLKLLMSYTLQPVTVDGLQRAAPAVVDAHTRHGGLVLDVNLPQPAAGPIADLERTAAQGDAKAQVELAVKYAFAEGVPKDQLRANNLFCRAAKYGYAEGLYNLGWVYANGRGVARDDGVAAALFRMAAERGHAQAARLLAIVRENADVQLPACLAPAPLPVAVLPPAPLPLAESLAEQPIPIAPKEIMQLVQRLAPQYEIDSNLALALISVESAFNPAALSPANAQGLMQLIPETAQRFGVKRPFDSDENIKGGLAYLRWLLAYFQGDVSLVLAAYNAGENAVEKYRGIPPYAETRDYVRKIMGMYRRTSHPYNPHIVKPSSIVVPQKHL
jgi:soluble lytic murein transglycosylase-like protein